MTYFPQETFKNILSFCDDRLERKARLNHKKTVNIINKIINDNDFNDNDLINPNDNICSFIYEWSCDAYDGVRPFSRNCCESYIVY